VADDEDQNGFSLTPWLCLPTALDADIAQEIYDRLETLDCVPTTAPAPIDSEELMCLPGLLDDQKGPFDERTSLRKCFGELRELDPKGLSDFQCFPQDPSESVENAKRLFCLADGVERRGLTPAKLLRGLEEFVCLHGNGNGGDNEVNGGEDEDDEEDDDDDDEGEENDLSELLEGYRDRYPSASLRRCVEDVLEGGEAVTFAPKVCVDDLTEANIVSGALDELTAVACLPAQNDGESAEISAEELMDTLDDIQNTLRFKDVDGDGDGEDEDEDEEEVILRPQLSSRVCLVDPPLRPLNPPVVLDCFAVASLSLEVFNLSPLPLIEAACLQEGTPEDIPPNEFERMLPLAETLTCLAVLPRTFPGELSPPSLPPPLPIVKLCLSGAGEGVRLRPRACLPNSPLAPPPPPASGESAPPSPIPSPVSLFCLPPDKDIPDPESLRDLIGMTEETQCFPKLPPPSSGQPRLPVLLLSGAILAGGAGFRVAPKKCLVLNDDFSSFAPEFEVKVCFGNLLSTPPLDAPVAQSYCLQDAEIGTEGESLADLANFLEKTPCLDAPLLPSPPRGLAEGSPMASARMCVTGDEETSFEERMCFPLSGPQPSLLANYQTVR